MGKFKRYLEEVSPRLSNDVKKLGKLIEYLINKSQQTWLLKIKN